MREPVRLWDDPEVSADLRADLHRASKTRAAFDPEAGLSRLLVAVSVSAAPAAAKTAAEGAEPAKTATDGAAAGAAPAGAAPAGAAPAGAGAAGASAAGAAGAGAAGVSAATTAKGLALLLGKGAYWALAAIGVAGVVAAVSLGKGSGPPSPAPAISAPAAAAPSLVAGAPTSGAPVPEIAPASGAQSSPEPAGSAHAEPAGTAHAEPAGSAHAEAAGSARAEAVGSARAEAAGNAHAEAAGSARAEPAAEPAGGAHVGASAAAASVPAAQAPASAPRRILAAEVKHLAGLRERLDARPDDVLAEADRSARSFPGGALAQERDALAIEALVRLGRTDEARARASVFVARYPRSPLALRVRALTGG